MARRNEKKSAAVSNPLKILYVEDSPADAELCLHDLKKAGFEPHADIVCTSVEFKQKLRRNSYDVILSDCSLPQFSVLEALKFVKAEAPDVPFIVVTGTLGDEGAVEAIKQGAIDYVLKDRRARLASSVRRALEEKRTLQEQKRAEEALRESEANFRTLAESVPQVVWMCTPDGMNTYFNQRWVDYTGLTLEQSYGRGWNAPFHPEDKQRAWNAWNHAVATGDTYSIECRLRRADDTYHWFLTRGAPLRDSTGRIIKWFGTCTDIEDMKRAEEELQRLNRALRTISECNEALVRAQGEQELLDQICQILVDKGGYRLVWVSYAAAAVTDGIWPAAHAGNEDTYLSAAKASHSGNGNGGWPCEQAILTGQVCIMRTSSVEPGFALWRDVAESHGFASAIALPLNQDGKPMGALTLHAEDPQAFDDGEVKLLKELADDLAYGIQSQRTLIERQQAEGALR